MNYTEAERLLNYHPNSSIEECKRLLDNFGFNEANDILNIIYETEQTSKDNNEIVSNENEIQDLITEIKKEFPDLDDEICRVYLGDYNNDIESVLKAIERSQVMISQFDLKDNENHDEDKENANANQHEEDNNLSKDVKMRIMVQTFPGIDKNFLNEILEIAGYDLDFAKTLVETSPHEQKQESNKNQQKKKVQTYNYFPEIPRTNKKKNRAQRKNKNQKVGKIPENLKPLVSKDIIRKSDVQILKNVFPDHSTEIIEESLNLAKGDIDRASEILLGKEPITQKETKNSNEARLHEIYPDVPISTIHNILKDMNYEEAANYLIENKDYKSLASKPSKDNSQEFHPESLRKIRTSPKKKHICKYIDLHGLILKDAIGYVNETINEILDEGQIGKLIIITGKGNSSKHGVPVLRPGIYYDLKRKNYDVFIPRNNSGMIICNIH